jgi:transcriptional regulator with XRE-family HTH domain
MGNDLGSFSWHVLDTIARLISDSGMTDAEVIKKSGMRRNTFYVKMRGETALTTEDIAKLAGALGIDPLELLRIAAEGKKAAVGGTSDDPTKMTDAELQTRYRLAADQSDPEQDLDERTP